jgi:hypothetical protein
MELLNDKKRPSDREVPGARPAAQPYRLAFVALAGQKIVLRPMGPVPANLPRELLPGDRLGSLSFAELATAFKGVVQLDSANGTAGTIESAEGAPRRLSFRVGGSGVVALRGLDGHRWSEDVPPGRPVFGVAPEILRSARQGVLVLDPASLSASLEGSPHPSTAPAAAHDDVAEPGEGPWRKRLLALALLLATAAGLAGWWGLDGRVEEETAPLPSPTAFRPPPLPGDVLTRLERVAGAVGDPAVRTELTAIAEAVRQERLAGEREHGQAAVSVIKAGAQLARSYRRDVADVRRLETALEVCGGDEACRAQYEPALARAEAVRELTRDAYLDLLRQAAETYPQALLENQLMVVEAQHGDLDQVGGVPDLARRFVAQVARWRDGSAGDREAIARELLGD